MPLTRKGEVIRCACWSNIFEGYNDNMTAVSGNCLLIDTRSHSKSDRLGRYYTNDDVSDVLVAQITAARPKHVLDLGAGAGSLSLAAMGKWKQAKFVTVDVDDSAASVLGTLARGRQRTRHQHVQADALRSDLPEVLSQIATPMDVGICNPPFIIPRWRKGFGEILEDTGFSSCLPVLSSVDAAVLFLAQNLRLLRDGGTLGIILPDTLVSASRYQAFRQELLRRYCVERVVRLPRGSFLNTDALAHIVVVKKRRPVSNFVSLGKLNGSTGYIDHELLVPHTDAIKRLDFEYHATTSVSSCSGTRPLSDIVEEVRRGRYSSAEIKDLDFPIFHTTDMDTSLSGTWCNLQRFGKKSDSPRPSNSVIARPGDILLARVGRNLEAKVLGVGSGFPILSDCVIKLRVKKAWRDNVLRRLTSPYGVSWLTSRAYGVGARQLTQADLLTFGI